LAYRGRYYQGDEIPLGVLTTDAAGVPVFPDACPQLEIYGPAGKVAGGWTPGGLGGSGSPVPVQDRFGTTGLFGINLLLGSLFSPGLYQATYRWTSGAHRGLALDTFEVLPGSSARGTPISMYFHDQPQANYLVRQLDSGRLVANRNPRV
jgi:hypothetical protein